MAKPHNRPTPSHPLADASDLDNAESLFEAMREQMLAEIEARTEALTAGLDGRILSDRVMAAIARVPRHEFVPADVRPFAYLDRALPIGFGKSVSQPFITALMTDLLEVGPTHRVLEIGTGCGYHAALLAELGASVFSVELIPELVTQAVSRLARLGYDNIAVRMGNGCLGWPEHAPFDRILLTAGAELIPGELLMQLAPGGRLVLPAGIEGQQQLTAVERSADGRLHTQPLLPVQFAPLEENGGLHGSA